MSYRFTMEPSNYEDLSSGRVLYNRYGTTAFPVRLADEIFQQAKHDLTKKGNTGPYSLYDPCCGGGYLLTTLGFLHRGDIRAITATDVDPDAVELASRNLSLLTPQGLQQRTEQIRALYEQFGKESHQAALESASRLSTIVNETHRVPSIECFEADATEPLQQASYKYGKFDMIITDLPYGNIVEWSTSAGNPAERLLDNAARLLAPVSLIAIVSSKEQKISHAGYDRVSQWKLGKRRVTLLKLKAESTF